MLKEDDVFEDVPKGFIQDFTEAMVERIQGVNRDYIIMCAETILAGVSFKVCHYNRIGKMNLGIWGLGITRSGEWKTVPIRNYAIPIMSRIQKDIPPIGKVVKKILIPSRFSPEGLIEFMTVHKELSYNEDKGEDEEIRVISNEGLMIRDEFTGLLKGVKNKDWMSDVSEVLSEIYDTSIQPYYTKKSKLQEVPYCNISFLMATTPHIYDIMDETFFVQGLGNRLDFVVFDPPEKPPQIQPEEFFEQSWSKEKDTIIDEFASKLSGIVSSPLQFINVPSEKIGKLWTDYRYEIELRKRRLSEKGAGSIRWSYLSRQSEKVLRRAGLYCISRNIDSIPHMKDLDTLVLNEEDMRLAIQRQEKYYEYFEVLLGRWLRHPQPRGAAQTDLVDLERMLAIVDNAPHKMISNPQWMDEAGYGFRNKFYEIKKTLMLRGDVEEMSDGDASSLSGEEKNSLDLHDPRVKVYRLTDKYFRERGLEKPKR